MTMAGQGQIARDYSKQLVHYYRKRLTAGSAGNQTVIIGKVPIGANIMRASTLVRTAYTGGTPTISLGTEAGGVAALAAALGAAATTLGRNALTLAATALLGVDVDTNLTATVGGVPTGGGVVDIEVEFAVNNDQ